MAWTAPATFTTGNVLTAAQMNTNVRDNTNFLHDPPGCQISRTATQGIATGTVGVQATLGVVNYDTDSMTGTANYITVSTAGVYHFSINLEWAAQSGGSRAAIIYDAVSAGLPTVAISFVSPSGTTAANSASGDLVCVATQRFGAYVWQNSGSTVSILGTNSASNIGAGNAPAYFSAHWVGAG